MRRIIKLGCLLSCALVLSACGQDSDYKSSMEITSKETTSKAGDDTGEFTSGAGMDTIPASSGESSETSAADEESVVFRAQILQVQEDSLLVKPLEGEEIKKPADQIIVHADKDTLPEGIAAGNIVEIYFPGFIMETYPAQIACIYNITVIDDGGDEEDDVEQLQLIAENKDLWLGMTDEILAAVEPCSYAVTDLNQNGRLEIIVSSCQGTGIYTYSNIFEVNETMDGLMPYERVLEEYVSEADIITETAAVYYDSETNIYHYIFDDFSKNGAAEYFENKRDWSLQDGQIIEKFLAYKSVIYTGTDLSVPQITCRDAGEGTDQREITEEEYDNIEDTVFAGLDKKLAHIHWITRESASSAEMSTSEVLDMLSESWGAFFIE